MSTEGERVWLFFLGVDACIAGNPGRILPYVQNREKYGRKEFRVFSCEKALDTFHTRLLVRWDAAKSPGSVYVLRSFGFMVAVIKTTRDLVGITLVFRGAGLLHHNPRLFPPRQNPWSHR